jgi:hypothetical protein
VNWAIDEKSYSQRRACGSIRLDPKTYRYASRRSDEVEIRVAPASHAAGRSCLSRYRRRRQDHPRSPDGRVSASGFRRRTRFRAAVPTGRDRVFGGSSGYLLKGEATIAEGRKTLDDSRDALILPCMRLGQFSVSDHSARPGLNSANTPV